ncbi:MAG: hypothetical protein B7Z15_09060 [Rhizobiales bacterium 32-66-8]|nr:MAG: hypothetical protein B7Z15_09060 [Rhizobiales bacterium 32-66-8]
MLAWAALGLAALALGGCTTTSSNPAALIPTEVQASIMAEDRMRGSDGSSGSVSVQDILARARASGDAAPQQQAAGAAGAEGGDPAVTGSTAQAGTGSATASGPSTGPWGGSANPPQAAPATRLLAAQPLPGQALASQTLPSQALPSQALPAQTLGARSARGGGQPVYELVYDGTEDQPPPLQAAGLAKAVKALKLPGKTQVTIMAGPGPGTTPFDQALLANRRARAVKTLLPGDWEIKQLYDPEMPPDTVSIVLGSGI